MRSPRRCWSDFYRSVADLRQPQDAKMLRLRWLLPGHVWALSYERRGSTSIIRRPSFRPFWFTPRSGCDGLSQFMPHLFETDDICGRPPLMTHRPSGSRQLAVCPGSCSQYIDHAPSAPALLDQIAALIACVHRLLGVCQAPPRRRSAERPVRSATQSETSNGNHARSAQGACPFSSSSIAMFESGRPFRAPRNRNGRPVLARQALQQLDHAVGQRQLCSLPAFMRSAGMVQTPLLQVDLTPCRVICLRGARGAEDGQLQRLRADRAVGAQRLP